MSVEQKLAELEVACTKQTEASQELSQEVAEKMAQIDIKAAQAIMPLGENVATYYVDAATGSDTNTGTNTANSFKTLDHALTVAESPEMRGKMIYIYCEGGNDYHISEDHNFHHRNIYLSSRSWANRANLYMASRLSSGQFATYGVGLIGSSIAFANLNIYLPLFSELTGHDSTLSSSSGGLVRGIYNDLKHVYIASCHIYVGDQYIISPLNGECVTLMFNSVTVSRREGYTSAHTPITLVNYTPLIFNAKNLTLSDGLLMKEGSLISGVKFVNGTPVNVVSNISIAEATA